MEDKIYDSLTENVETVETVVEETANVETAAKETVATETDAVPEEIVVVETVPAEKVIIENKANEKPKYCIARAIVSLGLGIYGIVFGLLGGIYVAYEVISGLILVFAKYAAPISNDFPVGISAIIFVIGVAIFDGLALAMSIVSRFQANKFVELYDRPSKLATAGKITGTIGMCISIVMIAISVLFAVVMAFV